MNNASTNAFPCVIGLYSQAPQSGKRTVARFLAESYGYEIVPFAHTLKCMTRVFLQSLYGDLATFEWMNANKDMVVIDKCYEHITVRRLMQLLGTEWGRELLGRDVWVDQWRRSVSDKLLVVADDMRFPNEFEAVRALGGETWCVIRGNARREGAHASEGALDHRVFSRYIYNDQSLGQLHDYLQGTFGPAFTSNEVAA